MSQLMTLTLFLFGRPFLTKYNEKAVWFDDLEPLDGQELPWDEAGLPRPIPEDAYSYHKLGLE